MSTDEPRTLPELLDAWEAAGKEEEAARNLARWQCANDVFPTAEFRRADVAVKLKDELSYLIRQRMLVLNFMEVKRNGRLYYWTCFNNLRAVDVAEVSEASTIEVVR